MHLANAQGNPVFPGPAIERPTIARILPDLKTRDLRFYDVNGDLRQDLIANLSGQVMALDGMTLDSLFSFGRAESVVLGEDRLFLKDRRGGFYCYDFISGASPWSRDLDGLIRTEPVVHRGRLYDVTMTMDGGSLSARILCLDADSGETLWSQELGKGYSSFGINMVVNDRAVILPMPREPDRHVFDVFALDPGTGRILWRRDRSSVSKFMALDEEHLYGHLGRFVFGAIDLATGHLAWSYAYAASNPSMLPRSNLIILPDRVVTGSSRGGLMALTKSDGLLIWTRPSVRPYAMTAVGDMLHVGHGSGAGDSLMALSLHTGATHWQLPLTRRHPQRIVYQSGRLLLDSEYGVAVIADSASIAEVGSRGGGHRHVHPRRHNHDSLVKSPSPWYRKGARFRILCDGRPDSFPLSMDRGECTGSAARRRVCSGRATLVPPAKAKRLQASWAEAFRRSALPLIDEEVFAPLYCAGHGRPNRPVQTVLGVLLLKEMHGLTDAETLEQLEYNLQWHHALELTPEEAHLPQKTLHNFRVRLLAHDGGRPGFAVITDGIRQALGTKVYRQRLDSTHVMSNMAVLTRLGVFCETIRHLLKSLASKHPRLSKRVPAPLRRRYLKENGEATAYQDAPSGAGPRRLSVAARDLYRLHPLLAGTAAEALEAYALLQRLLAEQCDVTPEPQRPSEEEDDDGEGGVPVKLKAAEDVRSDSLQSPVRCRGDLQRPQGQGV